MERTLREKNDHRKELLEEIEKENLLSEEAASHPRFSEAPREPKPRKEAPTPERTTIQPSASTEPILTQKPHPSTVSHIVKKKKNQYNLEKTPVRQSQPQPPKQKKDHLDLVLEEALGTRNLKKSAPGYASTEQSVLMLIDLVFTHAKLAQERP